MIDTLCLGWGGRSKVSGYFLFIDRKLLNQLQVTTWYYNWIHLMDGVFNFITNKKNSCLNLPQTECIHRIMLKLSWTGMSRFNSWKSKRFIILGQSGPFNDKIYLLTNVKRIQSHFFNFTRYLEQVCSQSLPNHHETVVSMIQEAESRSDTPTKPIERLVILTT